MGECNNTDIRGNTFFDSYGIYVDYSVSAWGPFIDDSINITIERNKFDLNDIGLDIETSERVDILNNTFSHITDPLILDYCSNTSVIDNDIDGTYFVGITYRYCLYGQILNNKVSTSGKEGILMERSNQTIVMYNTIRSSGVCIKQIDCSDNTVSNNYCILLFSSENNFYQVIFLIGISTIFLLILFSIINDKIRS